MATNRIHPSRARTTCRRSHRHGRLAEKSWSKKTSGKLNTAGCVQGWTQIGVAAALILADFYVAKLI